MTRTLAPIADANNCEALFRHALEAKSLLEYRLPNSRKHSAVDLTSVNLVCTVFDKIKPETKAKIIRIGEANPCIIATMCWNVTQGGK